jgi:hypothetical protein
MKEQVSGFAEITFLGGNGSRLLSDSEMILLKEFMGACELVTIAV